MAQAVHGDLTDPNGELAFDAVFGEASTQVDVFDECRDLVQSVLDGYNVCIFTYGQTGAGKTYTLLGGHPDDKEALGVAPRTVTHLFEKLSARKQKDDQVQVQLKAASSSSSSSSSSSVAAAGPASSPGVRDSAQRAR